MTEGAESTENIEERCTEPTVSDYFGRLESGLSSESGEFKI